MTVILVDVIRHQLLYGEGLPFGLLSSGYTFSKFEFFSKDQVVYTPQFWLNGTSDDLFPTRLTEAHVGHALTSNVSEPNLCMVHNSFTDDHCVSRAYQKMQAFLESAPRIVYRDWIATFRESTFARVITLHEHVETWTRVPHVATAYIQDILWWDPLWFDRFRSGPSRRVSVVESQAANVRTVCLPQNVTVSTTQIRFPLLELYRAYLSNTTATVSVETRIWSQDDVSFVDPDLVRTVWVDGAQNIEAVTAGLVVLSPLESPNSTVRSVLACSVDARWGDSNHIQADGPLDIAISADVRHPRRDDGSESGYLPANSSHWKHIKASMAWLDALTPTVPYLSLGLDLTKSATTIANLLMITGHNQLPPIDGFDRRQQDSPYGFWESLISTYFADGVARVGYSRQLDSPFFFVDGSNQVGGDCVKPIPIVWVNVSTCVDDKPESANLTAFSLEGRLTGSKSLPSGHSALISTVIPVLRLTWETVYAYRASAKTDFASIGVILTYVCVAIVHFFYCVIRRRSSRAWTKPEDLLALALSSCPDPAVLSNTCAGMKKSGTKAKVVRIVVMRGGRDGAVKDEEASSEESDDEERRIGGGSVAKDAFARDEEAVQIRFVESMHDGATTFGRVQAGTKYGKMD
ncbi:MAG: hypothetical protein Q9190_005359 [Brigantiaea leucoxantha]